MKRHRRKALGARWFAAKWAANRKVRAEIAPYPVRLARLLDYDRRAEVDPCVCDFITPSFDRLVEVSCGR
jgi:hypothetical protein